MIVYRVDTFYVAIESIVTEFDHRFNEAFQKVLQNISCIDPRLIATFNVMKFAQFIEIYYYEDLSNYDHEHIQDTFYLFIIHMKRIEDFIVYLDVASLTKNTIVHKRHIMFTIVLTSGGGNG